MHQKRKQPVQPKHTTMQNTLIAIAHFAQGLQPEQIARLMNIELDVLAQLVSKYITF